MATKESARLLNTRLPKTDRFIYRALRGEPAPWADLGPQMPAQEFLKQTEHHGVQALLFHCVHESDAWKDWPQDVRQVLERASKAGVAQEMLRTHHLSRILKEFDRAGVRCLLMKGEALALSHYSTPGTRTRCDSDLFIHLGDIEAARQALLDADLNIVSQVYKSHQFTVSRTGDVSGAVQFDVHWRISNHPLFARVISFEDAFDNSLAVPGMENARMLNAVDALLLACMHRMGNERHDRNRLIWINDIHELTTSMDANELMEFASKAVRLGVQAACLDGLSRSVKCLLTAVPDSVIEVLKTPELPRSRSVRIARSSLGLLIDDWRNLVDRRSRLGLLRELVWPSSSYLLQKYHKNSKLWLPVLYLRQVLGGAFERLSLR
ncbi:nucleotidyltransferase family protein [Pseudomonadota bacterium]